MNMPETLGAERQEVADDHSQDYDMPLIPQFMLGCKTKNE
jgi:hypothetical protein